MNTFLTAVLPASLFGLVAGIPVGIWCMYRLINFTKRIHQPTAIVPLPNRGDWERHQNNQNNNRPQQNNGAQQSKAA